jgi:hypothetical protein
MTDRMKLAIQKAIRTQPRTVDEWLVARAKFPSEFTVNQDGDLVSPAFKDGTASSVIELRPEVPASKEHIQTFFTKRLEGLKEPEEIYTSAKRHLHEVIRSYKAGQATIADVLGANQDVHDAECRISEKAKFPRYSVELTGSLIESDLTFERYEARPIAERVYSVEYTTFPWNAFWMPPSAAEEQAALPAVQEDAGSEQPQPKRRSALTPQQRAIIAARINSAARTAV